MEKDKKQALTFYKVDVSTILNLVFADNGVKAGFPSPAQDYIDQSIDLNKELIKNPASTFLARVNGDSMIDAYLNNGDLLVVDKSEDYIDKEMYVCYIDGEFTIKYVEKEKDKIRLVPANKDYEPIEVTCDNDLRVWGRVMHIIKKPSKLKR